MKKIILSAMLGAAIFLSALGVNVQANNLSLNDDLSIGSFQFEKSNNVQYTLYRWQCQKCGKVWTTGRSDFRPPQGRCGDGNHVWAPY